MRLTSHAMGGLLSKRLDGSASLLDRSEASICDRVGNNGSKDLIIFGSSGLLLLVMSDFQGEKVDQTNDQDDGCEDGNDEACDRRRCSAGRHFDLVVL